MPQISIITSAYNTPVKYLQKYLDSVLTQTYRDFELIIVDDASTNEETVAFLRGINDDRVRVFFQERNQGISVCRNFALRHAVGEYICVLDSDDYYDVNFLQDMISPVNDSNEVDMTICTGYTCVDEMSEYCGVTPKESFNDIFSFCQKPTGCRLMRRSMLIDNDILFPAGKIYEDNVFCVAGVLCAYTIKPVQSYGYINRQHTNSFSHGRLYRAVEGNKIPYDYIKENICKIVAEKILNKKETAAILGEAFNILGTCVLLFSRETEAHKKRELMGETSNFIRTNISHYVRNTILWCRHGHAAPVIKMLQMCYAVSIMLHCDKIYVELVHRLFESQK